MAAAGPPGTVDFGACLVLYDGPYEPISFTGRVPLNPTGRVPLNPTGRVPLHSPGNVVITHAFTAFGG